MAKEKTTKRMLIGYSENRVAFYFGGIMKVGINLDTYESPMEDTRNLVNNYGYHREIGYLKINPERLPVIVSERRALADIRAMENHKAVYPLHDRRYELIVDDRAISFMVQHKGGFLLFGNGYIAKRQGRMSTALTMDEILEWLKELEKSEIGKNYDSHFNQTVIGFEFDEEKECYR